MKKVSEEMKAGDTVDVGLPNRLLTSGKVDMGKVQEAADFLKKANVLGVAVIKLDLSSESHVLDSQGNDR